MSDVETANPAEGEATPDTGAEHEAPEQQFDDRGEPIDQPEPEEEFEEVERGDKKYRIPKALAPELLMQADYTRKTQEVAETRKQVEAQQAAVERQTQAAQANIQDYAALAALNQQLAEYRKVDFAAWARQGGDAAIEAQAAHFEMQELERTLNGAQQSLYAKEQQSQQEGQRAIAKAISEGEAVLKTRIKDWSPDYEGKLIEFGAGYGLAADDIRQAKAMPGQIEILHLARIGAESLKQRAAATRHEQAQSTQPAPVIRGNSRGPAKSLADLAKGDFADFEKAAEARAKAG